MVNILKIVKGAVKMLSVVIMIAFLFNSLIGVRTIFNIIDDNGFDIENPEAGDFQINFENLHVELNLLINNTGIYPMEDITIGMNCSIESNVTEFTTVLDYHTPTITIPRNEFRNISLVADLAEFEFDPIELGTIFNLTAPWDMADLLDQDFNIIIILTFEIKYAFKQYQLDFEIVVPEATIAQGFA
jgi:hypothetical protein